MDGDAARPALPDPAEGPIGRRGLVASVRALPRPVRRFWTLVPLVGALAGIFAVGTVKLLEWMQRLAWGPDENLLAAVMHASPGKRVLLPLAAGVLVTLASLVVRTPLHFGTSRLIETIWVREGRVPMGVAVLQAVLSLAIVALGASLGREGALITTSAAAASFLGRRARLDADRMKLLVACGATAGMAAAYNTPLGGALFGLEVFLGGLALDLYGPLIVAAVVSTLISRALLFDHPSYQLPGYRLEHPFELPLYLALGAIAGVLSAVLVRAFEAGSRAAARVPPLLRRLLPIPALLAVGLVGILRPEVYGNGYGTVNAALAGRLPIELLLVLPLLKLALTVGCSSAGAPGGLFTPMLYIGGLTGGAFGAIAGRLLPHVVGAPGGYVLVGMGAILAGSTHAMLSAPLLLFELTGNYALILPLLSASLVATVVSVGLAPGSLYTAPLRQRGLELPGGARPAWMQREGVSRLVRVDHARTSVDTPLSELLLQLARLDEGERLYVVDTAGSLRGAISLEAVRDALTRVAHLDTLVAADLLAPAEGISVDASLWEATRRALAAGTARLPVVSPREAGRFVGVISTREILSAAAHR